MPQETSTIAVPIETDLRALEAPLDAALPRTLWTIDQRVARCVPPQHLKLFGARVKVTPAIACTLSGEVTRGPLRLRGNGKELVADIPVSARITARDTGGVLKGETATGSALVEAHIVLDVAPDWSAHGRVRLHYDWTEPPSVDLLGQRITFTDKADEKLQPVVRKLEATLPRELARLDLRAKAATAWRAAFTSLSLNDANPPVWMRITPRAIKVGGYDIAGQRLRIDAGLDALTETFVGPRPPDPVATPLPNLTKAAPQGGLRFFIPVTAAYGELEPVVLRALVKRSDRPFDLPGLGPVRARFDHIVAYGTTGQRIAVGIDLRAAPESDPSDITRGRIWLLARPVNAPGSARISFSDLSVQGATDRTGGDLLVALGNSPVVAGLVASALEQDLGHDLDKLIGKVDRAIAVRREGDFLVRATLGTVQAGVIQAAGDGLHLPVRANGTATISYKPGNGPIG